MLTNYTNTVLYIGITRDLAKRVREHKGKINGGFTNKYNVDKLVYFESYHDVKEAIRREKELKGWKRERKNQLIELENPAWTEIKL